MSRAKLIKRMDELEALLRRGSASAERRFLEGLSDQELDALYLRLGGELEPESGQRREPVRRVVTSRDVEGVSEDPPLTDEIEEAPEPVAVPPDSGEVKGEPPASAPLRSCDFVQRSPWAGPPVERGEAEEVTFRGKPLEPAYSVRPRPRRRRRSRRA